MSLCLGLNWFFLVWWLPRVWPEPRCCPSSAGPASSLVRVVEMLVCVPPFPALGTELLAGDLCPLCCWLSFHLPRLLFCMEPQGKLGGGGALMPGRRGHLSIAWLGRWPLPRSAHPACVRRGRAGGFHGLPGLFQTDRARDFPR